MNEAQEGPSQSPAAAEPKVPPTADDIDRQWRCFGVIEVMIRNPAVDDFVREKEAEIDRLTEEVARLKAVVRSALSLKAGWREAIVELEDHCSEPVRLKNMIAAADQLDEWASEARAALLPRETT